MEAKQRVSGLLKLRTGHLPGQLTGQPHASIQRQQLPHNAQHLRAGHIRILTASRPYRRAKGRTSPNIEVSPRMVRTAPTTSATTISNPFSRRRATPWLMSRSRRVRTGWCPMTEVWSS
jgi:hypothetical protein